MNKYIQQFMDDNNLTVDEQFKLIGVLGDVDYSKYQLRISGVTGGRIE